MLYTIWNVISQQRNETEIRYIFCCVWSRIHWKSIATRSSFFMCKINLAVKLLFDECKWLLKCYWKVENVIEVQRRWRVEFDTTTNKGNNDKNPRHVWIRWNGARRVERSVRKRVKFHWKRECWCSHAGFCTIPKEIIEAMFSWDWYREIQCS